MTIELSPTVEPTDRSIPPDTSTTVSPAATIISTELAIRMFLTFWTVRKYGETKTAKTQIARMSASTASSRERSAAPQSRPARATPTFPASAERRHVAAVPDRGGPFSHSCPSGSPSRSRRR